ncbi:hypothetical protein QYE76_068047 [Lolium multiflorum]|uniref:Aminotransferase-like plant mobile domain-containing protein n=1 Tax=Lolium multiflorum TaxID=4521 RepID=A0AAD8SDP4_LOLMU|nr:hypothetical protein QYE76_068047 [Lolium multiflorum]
MNATALTALVDRWRPEKHTFHLRAGEMTPTLQDVSMILGLPIQGEWWKVGPLVLAQGADEVGAQVELGNGGTCLPVPSAVLVDACSYFSYGAGNTYQLGG